MFADNDHATIMPQLWSFDYTFFDNTYHKLSSPRRPFTKQSFC